MNPKFNGWWENGDLTQDNKYDKGSPCWWAWELSKAAPQKGSYAKLLAICSNEIGKSRLTHKD